MISQTCRNCGTRFSCRPTCPMCGQRIGISSPGPRREKAPQGPKRPRRAPKKEGKPKRKK